MKYKNYLENVLGYTGTTTNIYAKYALELETIGLDYKELMNVYKDSSNNTKRLILSSIKRYYSYIGDSRKNEIILPKRDIKFQEYVEFEEYKKILSNINKKTTTGFSKYIMIRIFFETGIRSTELLWITKTNVINNSIKINGKGNKQRKVYMSEWLTTEVNEYINSISTLRLFPFGYKNLYKKVSTISNRKITPHMFRRGYAKYCHEKGIPIYDISLSMGHSDISTTAKYIEKNSEDVNICAIF